MENEQCSRIQLRLQKCVSLSIRWLHFLQMLSVLHKDNMYPKSNILYSSLVLNFGWKNGNILVINSTNKNDIIKTEIFDPSLFVIIFYQRVRENHKQLDFTTQYIAFLFYKIYEIDEGVGSRGIIDEKPELLCLWFSNSLSYTSAVGRRWPINMGTSNILWAFWKILTLWLTLWAASLFFFMLKTSALFYTDDHLDSCWII